jgi:hypothetical protein
LYLQHPQEDEAKTMIDLLKRADGRPWVFPKLSLLNFHTICEKACEDRAFWCYNFLTLQHFPQNALVSGILGSRGKSAGRDL